MEENRIDGAMVSLECRRSWVQGCKIEKNILENIDVYRTTKITKKNAHEILEQMIMKNLILLTLLYIVWTVALFLALYDTNIF
jgi:hypothetical protein